MREEEAAGPDEGARMSLPAPLIRRRRAAGILLLFLLYLGAPFVHVLHHARAGGHAGADFDAAAHLAGIADAHHAGDCPLCQALLHAAPAMQEAEFTATPTSDSARATAPLTPLSRLRPSVCWTGPRGPPAA